MIQIDLRAPTIPQDRRVWRLFPGVGYQFLGSFLKQRVGFLDFPGLVPPEGRLSDAPDLIARIARSQAVRDGLYKFGLSFDPKGLKVADFASARRTQKRGRLRQALINFYQEAKKGDYVVLPEPLYQAQIHVGKIASDRVVEAFFERRYGQVPIPARQINWLAHVSENMVSGALSHALRHQHPFTLLEQSLYIEVFSIVHGSFVYGERHTSTIYNDKQDFLDSAAALLGTISRLAAAALQSIEENHDSLDEGDLLDVLIRNPPIEYTCSQVTDIHSPGFNRYISGTIVSLIIAATGAALLGLSDQSSKATLAGDIKELKIINSAPDADPQCNARVSEATARILKALGIDKTWALCEAAKAAQARTGLRSSATPKHLPPLPSRK